MDNLHFIPNNIFIKFFKELTKYKNDYQQYLNYIYIRIILCILLYIFKCINTFAQGYNLQASKKNNKRRSIVTLKTLKGIPIFKGNHKGFFFLFFLFIYLFSFTNNFFGEIYFEYIIISKNYYISRFGHQSNLRQIIWIRKGRYTHKCSLAVRRCRTILQHHFHSYPSLHQYILKRQ